LNVKSGVTHHTVRNYWVLEGWEASSIITELFNIQGDCTLKEYVFCVVCCADWLPTFRRFRVKYSNWGLRGPIDLEDGGSMFLLNVGKDVLYQSIQRKNAEEVDLSKQCCKNLKYCMEFTHQCFQFNKMYLLLKATGECNEKRRKLLRRNETVMLG
jgi:hypothetical protein